MNVDWMEWMIMSFFGNKKDRALVDLKQLRKDYREGHTAMGHPERGYYITNWRGMQSLQAFSTSESVLLWAGDRNDRNVREVQIQNGGSDYEMRAWTDRRYIDMLNTELYEMDEGVDVNRTYWDRLDSQVYESIINNIYNGELDKEALLDTATSTHHDVDYMRQHVTLAFKHDVLRAKDGDTDLHARAAGHAYLTDLAANARSVDFDYGPYTPERDSSLGERYENLTEDQWLASAERSYLGYILDDFDGTTSTTVQLDDAKEVFTEFVENSRTQVFGQRAQEWYDMVDIMIDKDVVFMVGAEPEPEIGLGMRYQNDVHDALDLDVATDLDLSFNQPVTFNLDSGGYIAEEEDNGFEP